MANEKIELLAAYWTLAVGAEPHGDHEYSAASFRERVEAAARAGFKGFGIWHSDLAHTLERSSLQEMRQVLDDHGIRHVELEFLTDWFLDGEAKRKSDELKEKLFEAANVLGARSIKVGDFSGTACPMPRLIDAFGTLCAEAARRGNARIAYEMMPFAAIDSIELAQQLAEGTAAANGGIYFDLWHVVKLGIPFDKVAQFPARYCVGIEINDGYLKSMPSFVEETTQHRQLCGRGEFDVRGFVRTLREAGWAGPWGVEVLNGELRHQPLAEVAPLAYHTTMEQFT